MTFKLYTTPFQTELDGLVQSLGYVDPNIPLIIIISEVLESMWSHQVDLSWYSNLLCIYPVNSYKATLPYLTMCWIQTQ